MKLSSYQQAIIQWVKQGRGNGCCNAVAGSGKSTTLRLAAMALLDSGFHPSDIKVIVFGKANAQDLIAKFGRQWQESISTLHSTGFSLLKQELNARNHQNLTVNRNKYKKIAQDLRYIDSRRFKGTLKRREAISSDSDFLKLLDLVRLTNQSPFSEIIRDLCLHFELPDVREFSLVAHAIADCLEQGEKQAQSKLTFDFNDQIWLPVKWQLSSKRWFKPYQFVLVDECQDLNAAQLELSLSLAGSQGRLLYVGDPRQAIMGFAGADNRSYDHIVERTQATELPLSLCYRCPTSHIELVKRIFPDIPIEAHPHAVKGLIQSINEADLDKYLKTGDLVISRKTAPLVSLCIKLIARGIAATVKGKAIGEQIKLELKKISEMPLFTYQSFSEAVNVYRESKIQRYVGLDNEEQLIETLNDKLMALTTIYHSNPQANSIIELETYIDDLFSDSQSPITLSTCHRAKGLEGERIFLLKPNDMPMRWRKQQLWQKEQEDNLLYVALTRSKSDLFIIGEADWYQGERERGREGEGERGREGEKDHPVPQSPSPPVSSSNNREEPKIIPLSPRPPITPSSPSVKTVNRLQSPEEKRQRVTEALLDPKWQQSSDRAISVQCGVSAPFVGKIRKQLVAEGRIQVLDERIDRQGRILKTSEIGTRPKITAKDKIAKIVQDLDKQEILALSQWLKTLAED